MIKLIGSILWILGLLVFTTGSTVATVIFAALSLSAGAWWNGYATRGKHDGT